MIAHTRSWISNVVIGCHFCPFAAQVFVTERIRYAVFTKETMTTALAFFLEEIKYLEQHAATETTLVIFPAQLEGFPEYLRFLKEAEKLVARKGYTGRYQIASFHPQYLFGQSEGEDDASNYTNRSVYPMLQLLRERSITRALKHFPDPENIPERNVSWARSKGIDHMRLLLASCMD